MSDSLLKKIDIKTTPLLIAIDVVLIIAKLLYRLESPLLVLVIIGLSLYLFILLVMWVYNKYSDYSETKSIKLERNAKARKRINESEELIWNYFLSLPDMKLQNLVQLVELPAVVNERQKRVIKAHTPLRGQFANDEYSIPVEINRSLVLLMYPNNNAYNTSENLVVVIDDYFLRLIEKYIETGERVRV